MKALTRIYLCFAYFLAIGLFLLISLSFNLACWITHKAPGIWGSDTRFRRILQAYFIFWARFMQFLNVLNLQTPAKTQPASDTGQMWLCNHPTILDGSYLLKFITNGSCIYKDAIGSNPFYGSTVKLAKHLPNVGGPDLVRNAVEKLKAGQDLVIFPEGTRCAKLDTSLFKPGFALIAKRAATTINLLWTDNPSDFLTRESPLWKAPRLPASVNIRHFATIHCDRHSSVSEIFQQVIDAYQAEAEKPSHTR